MGIARAIRRVKRQAKQGGLNAVITGLGEGLRSRSVPAPLRGAARKIAAIIDPTRATKKRASGVQRSHGNADGRPEIDPGIAKPPDEVTATGVDSGAEPSEPADGTPVDAAAVGATPTFNATPLEVEPVDATPVEVASHEIKAVEIELSPAVPAKPAASQPKPAVSPAKPQAKKSAQKKPPASSAKASPKTKTAEPTKEKLAASTGAAKSVARSGSRAAKKPASTKAVTSSKKK